MTDKEFAARVDAATERVVNMDHIDGFEDRDLKTILFALEAGLKRPDTFAAFDALVMLRDVCHWRQPSELATPDNR